jgi:hypothetical protein
LKNFEESMEYPKQATSNIKDKEGARESHGRNLSHPMIYNAQHDQPIEEERKSQQPDISIETRSMELDISCPSIK